MPRFSSSQVKRGRSLTSIIVEASKFRRSDQLAQLKRTAEDFNGAGINCRSYKRGLECRSFFLLYPALCMLFMPDDNQSHLPSPLGPHHASNPPCPNSILSIPPHPLFLATLSPAQFSAPASAPAASSILTTPSCPFTHAILNAASPP